MSSTIEVPREELLDATLRPELNPNNGRRRVKRKTINTVENGVFVPSTILALRLARVLGQPVEALFALED